VAALEESLRGLPNGQACVHDGTTIGLHQTFFFTSLFSFSSHC